MEYDRILQDLNGIESKTDLDLEMIEFFKPKKPLNLEVTPDTMYGECPMCGAYVNDWFSPRVCATCGSTLKWPFESLQKK